MTNIEKVKQIRFVIFFALGLLIVHELGHIIHAVFFIPNCQFREIIFLPFLSIKSDYLIAQCFYGFPVTARNLFIYHIGEFVFPFLFQMIYLIVFRKRLTTMELFLWFFISLLYLDGDFLNMYYYLKGGL